MIRKQRDYIAALRRAVREGVDAARSLAELQETVTVPEELRLYVGRMFKDQIEKIHSEMTSRG